MVSTISRQEKAGAMCKALTVCEMSRMRRRCCRHRARAEFTSKVAFSVMAVAVVLRPQRWTASGRRELDRKHQSDTTAWGEDPHSGDLQIQRVVLPDRQRAADHRSFPRK